MKVSRIHGNPSELEYYANKTEYDFDNILRRNREAMCAHNKEFELARNVERSGYLEGHHERDYQRGI